MRRVHPQLASRRSVSTRSWITTLDRSRSVSGSMCVPADRQAAADQLIAVARPVAARRPRDTREQGVPGPDRVDDAVEPRLAVDRGLAST